MSIITPRGKHELLISLIRSICYKTKEYPSAGDYLANASSDVVVCISKQIHPNWNGLGPCKTKSMNYGNDIDSVSLGEGCTYLLNKAREPLNQAESQQALLSTIVECSQDTISNSSLAETVLSWNVSAERIFGYRAKEVATLFGQFVSGEISTNI